MEFLSLKEGCTGSSESTFVKIPNCWKSHVAAQLQEVFHVYLNKFEIALSHLFFIIFSNNKFTWVNPFSGNGQSTALFAGLKQSLKMSTCSQSLSV